MTVLRSALLAVCLAAATASVARADAMPGCAQGEHLQVNPTPPGSMHHGGGQCVPDASSGSHCSVVAPGAHTALAGMLALVGVTAAFALVRRRAR